ncbi:unnamed protein product [Paramecium pentaurelia]|uniref:Transmembrane protein n=1 Tax=Paramecium pentaurelia TaxID=43138 RepID=A0A8S1S6N8_9CILI|nr:unnamed protein product [Paramecium pentaurelia]
MQQLIQNNLRQDVQSIDNSNFNDQFSKKIQALLEYGLYDQAYERVMRNKQYVQENLQLLIELARLFNNFKQHKLALEIIKLSNVFNQQLDMHQDQQMIIFKQYYLETLVEMFDVQEVIKETKNIYNEQIRKTIQEELNLIETQKKGLIHQGKQQQNQVHEHRHQQLTIEIPKQKRYLFSKVIGRKTVVLLFVLFLMICYSIKKKNDLKFVLEKLKITFKQLLNI